MNWWIKPCIHPVRDESCYYPYRGLLLRLGQHWGWSRGGVNGLKDKQCTWDSTDFISKGAQHGLTHHSSPIAMLAFILIYLSLWVSKLVLLQWCGQQNIKSLLFHENYLNTMNNFNTQTMASPIRPPCQERHGSLSKRTGRGNHTQKIISETWQHYTTMRVSTKILHL